MKIPEKIFDQWNAIRVHGDMSEIARTAGVSPQAVARVFESGKASPDIFKAIARYYRKRIKLLQQYEG